VDAASILSALQAALPGAGCETEPATDRPTLVVARDRLLDVARVLRDDPGLRFLVLTEVTAVDYWPADPRFVVVYHLLAPERRGLLRLKVKLASDDAHVATLCGVWPSANWLEREVYDLFGVVFEGHPDLRRLMMPEDWEGHPLRKDYPVQIKMKPKVYEPLQMTEEEFHARIAADRRVRTRPKAQEPKA
jgi:NADH-quinone oxidoreductase subunit C